MRISDWSSDVCSSDLQKEPEMGGAQIVHEGVPHVRPALFEQPGADRQLVRHGEVAAAPGAHVDEQGQELDRLFGAAVDCLLLVSWIVRAGEAAGSRVTCLQVGEELGDRQGGGAATG